MTTPLTVFTHADQDSLAMAVAIAGELLIGVEHSDDYCAIQSVQGCRPTGAATEKAYHALSALRDRCTRESASDFWFTMLGQDADELNDTQEFVQSLIDARAAQAYVLTKAVDALAKAQQVT